MINSIGIIFCAYGNPDYVERCLEPWIKLKNKYNIKIAAVHGKFKEYNEKDGLHFDNDYETLDILEQKYYHKNLIDYLYIQNRYDDLGTGCLIHFGTESEIRDKGLQYLLQEKCDIIWLLDLDEFYTEEQIENIIKYVNGNPFDMWFSIPFKNYILNGKSYIKGFCPPRIFRRNGGDIVYAEIDSFYYDNDIKYKLSGDTFYNECCYKSFSNKSIPENLLSGGIKHLTWLHSNGKEKVNYQLKHFGHCSYKWNEEKQELEIDYDFYRKNNLPFPIIYKDE